MGEIGYDEDKFLHRLTWWQLRAIIRGYRKRERTAWLTTRWQAWVTARLMGSDAESPEDLMPLPFDRVTTHEEEKEDKEQLQRLLAQAREHNKRLKG